MRNTLEYPVTKDEVIKSLTHEQQKYLEPDAPVGGLGHYCLTIALKLVEKSDFVDTNYTPI